MLTMSPELWQADQEALVQNNNNLFKRQLTPKTEQYYEVFKTLKSLLKAMKTTVVGDTGALIGAKKAIETWQSLPISFPVSYLALDAFSRNPSLAPDTWRQQRVLSWTQPSVTFNRQIEVALEEARLRQSRKVQPQVSDTVNPFDISF